MYLPQWIGHLAHGTAYTWLYKRHQNNIKKNMQQIKLIPLATSLTDSTSLIIVFVLWRPFEGHENKYISCSSMINMTNTKIS